jgi:hypothetical protein
VAGSGDNDSLKIHLADPEVDLAHKQYKLSLVLVGDDGIRLLKSLMHFVGSLLKRFLGLEWVFTAARMVPTCSYHGCLPGSTRLGCGLIQHSLLPLFVGVVRHHLGEGDVPGKPAQPTDWRANDGQWGLVACSNLNLFTLVFNSASLTTALSRLWVSLNTWTPGCHTRGLSTHLVNLTNQH